VGGKNKVGLRNLNEFGGEKKMRGGHPSAKIRRAVGKVKGRQS